MAVPGSEVSTEKKQMPREWVFALLAGDITAPGPSTNDQQGRSSVFGPIINVTMEDLLRARSSCLLDMPPLQVHMDLLQWSTHLTNRFIAELVKPYMSCTNTTPPPHHDGENGCCQDGPCSPPPFATSSFSSRLNENTDEMASPWIHEANIKTEPCEMEDSKVGILPEEETSHCSTHHEGSPIHDDSDTLTDDSGISVHPCRDHKIRLTKDVPPAYAYWFRGVRCPICRFGFRGQSCISEVEEHVSTAHKGRSSPKVMEKLRRECTLEKVIGPGIRYCGCQSCLEAARLLGYAG